MYALHFKFLFAVCSKIFTTTALCTTLVAIKWYLDSFLIRTVEYLVLILLFLVVLNFQIWSQIRNSALEKKIEHLHESNEKNNSAYFLEEPSLRSSGEFDAILDFVLREASSYIFESQSVPDVHETFKVPVIPGIQPRECQVTATNGYAQHLNSLHRYGPTTLRKDANGGLVLSAAVGMRSVGVRYRHYAAKVDLGIFPPIYVSGELSCLLKPLILRVDVALRSPFSVELRSLRIENIGPLQVHVTGLGEWDFMLPDIKKAVLPIAQRELERQAVLRAEPVIQDALQRLTLVVGRIPKIRLLPQDSERPRYAGSLAMEPSLTLTPSNIAAAGGIAVGGIALLGLGLAAAFSGTESSRSDDEDE